MLGIEKEEVG